jgi:hypothetical protein
MARVKVYERATPDIKWVGNVLIQCWRIQWRDDETRGAANPETFEWREVPHEVPDPVSGVGESNG